MRSVTRRITEVLFEPAGAPVPDWRAFRQQEIALLLLNLGALVAVVLLPIFMMGEPRPLKTVVILVVYARAVEQLAELGWFVLRRNAPPPAFMRIWVHVSIWLNVAFAWLAAMLNLTPATHFVVLMAIPLIAAAFRVSLVEMLLVLAAALTLTFLEITLTFHATPFERFEEFFHGSTVAMLFIVTATMARLLAGSLKRSGLRLQRSLEELERTKDKLVAEENLAAVGRLSSAIAHEIRNPVAMIASSAALVKEGGQSRTDFMEIVQHEAKRLEQLTTDFLSYARTRPPQRGDVSMPDTLEYVRSLASAKAAAAKVRVEVSCTPALQANLDAFQMHQVLLNLLMNAIDATPPGGRVEIGARASSGGNTLIWVENTGEPIAREAVGSRIFEPFYTTKKGGTGLGLAIARNIVKAHGGILALAKNEPGRVRFEAAIPNQVE